jgi:hexosaminidase
MQVVQTTPFPTFSPTKESVYKFLDRFIGEMATLFPAPYFHMGADENNGVAWKQDSAVTAFMRKNHFSSTHEMQAYFVSRVHQTVSKYGKTMIGWDELFTKKLSKNVIVQVWTPQSAPELAQQIRAQGNPVIISKGLYLDHFLPAYIHYGLEFPSEDILGGEAAQWTEIANSDNLETRMWPRAAAIAERLWSPRTVRDSIDMYRRLFIMSDRLAEAGLQHQTGYDRMVLRFSSGFNYQVTHTLMDVLTPVKGYKRLFGFFNLPEAAMYPNAPLVRAADIAMVDPMVKWQFRKNVMDFLLTRSPASERAIRDQLNIWSVNYDQLQSLFDSSPTAKEVETHSKNLSALSLACMDALDLIKADKKPDAQWISDRQSLLTSAKGSYGEVELSVLPEMIALITQEPVPLPNSFPIF